MTSIKERQKQGFLEAITGADSEKGLHWKVLVYDHPCRDIINPLCDLKTLREHGVTLHMLLDAKREPIPDTPCCYCVLPIEKNIRRIAKDCADGLYSGALINFARPVSRTLLELLGRLLVENNCVSKIQRVMNMYLDYVSLAPNLASLEIPQSFLAYAGAAKEHDLKKYMERVAQGVVSLVVTSKSVPILRAPRGGPAEHVAKLVAKILNALVEGPEGTQLGLGTGIEERPVLLILDRNAADCASVLQHDMGYHTMAADLLGIKMNRVEVPQAGKPKPKTVVLDSDSDSFWRDYAGKPFPVAAEAHSKCLQEVVDKVKVLENANSAEMAQVVDALPEQIKLKALLASHSEIMQALLQKGKEREIYKFVAAEEPLLQKGEADLADLTKLLQEPQLLLEDKYRLIMLFVVSVDKHTDDQVEDLLKSMGDADPHYANALKGLQKMVKVNKLGLQIAESNEETPDSLWKMTSKFPDLNHLTQVLEGMRGTQRLLGTTSILDQVMKEQTPANADAVDDYLYLDPKVRGNVPKNARITSSFSRGFLFLLGGGTYLEYHNLQDYAEAKDKDLVYACSEIVDANAFINQLAKLA